MRVKVLLSALDIQIEKLEVIADKVIVTKDAALTTLSSLQNLHYLLKDKSKRAITLAQTITLLHGITLHTKSIYTAEASINILHEVSQWQ